MQAKTELILDDGAMHYIMQLLEEGAIHDNESIKMNYDAFCQVRATPGHDALRSLGGPPMAAGGETGTEFGRARP